jgi:hypothetical protein
MDLSVRYKGEVGFQLSEIFVERKHVYKRIP